MKSVEGIRKVFLEDIADNFTDVLENVRNRLKPIGVILDGFSQICCSLVVVAVAITVFVQKMRMNIVWRPITLTANINQQTRHK
jgi:hypothetical protein